MKSLMLLLVLFTALQFVNGGILLGSDKCTYGPSYWCENLDNAKDCSATQHCIKNVWSKKAPHSDNLMDDAACTFCKDIVSDLQEFADNNATQATIQQYLDRACAYMPDQFSLDECEKIGKHYIAEVMAMIESSTNPDTICSLIHLCGNQRDLPVKQSSSKFSASAPASGKVDVDLCDMCKQAESLVRGEVDDKDNQATMKKLLQGECQKLGDLAAECNEAIDVLMPQIVSFIDQTLNSSELCVMLHMCDSSVDVMAAAKASLMAHLKASQMKTHVVGVASRVGEDKCTVCEQIFNYLHILMNNNATEQQVEQMVESELCTQLGPLADTCKELAEQYFPQIWDKLVAELDPIAVCAELGLCTKEVAVPKVSKPANVDASVECVLCEFVMNKLESLIASNSTEAEIKAALDKVCGLLPATITDECDTFVEKYTDLIVKLIINEVSPQVVCMAIGLCSPTNLQVASENCAICEMALAYIKSDLSKSTTQQEIMQDLDKLCNKLSTDLAAKCDSVVQQLAPNIMKILSNDISPAQMCAEIGLCTSVVQKGKPDGLVHLYNQQSRLSNV